MAHYTEDHERFRRVNALLRNKVLFPDTDPGNWNFTDQITYVKTTVIIKK